MIAEILSVGTELLMGQIANTDAKYISSRLSELGVNIYRQTTVGDNPGRVKLALNEALSRSDMVITTGGLGPTQDDLTKEMVAEYFGLEMRLDEKSLEAIKRRMSSINREMTANNLKQAYFPVGAIIMPNLCGTAAGCIVEAEGKAVAVLPGPPHEMKDMFERQLAPYLQRRGGARIYSRYLRIFGVGESKVETLLSDLFTDEQPTLALYCGAGEVMARVSATDEHLLEPVAREIRNRLGDAVYGEGVERTLAQTALEMLVERGMTISFAESATGGMLSSKFVDNPGASDALNEAYITYSNEAKERLLGVSHDTLVNFGAVSRECAIEMARGARQRSRADAAISVTGIAGPDGGSDAKPVGRTFIGVSTAAGDVAKEFTFRGDRAQVRLLACQNAFNELRLTLYQLQ